MKYKKIPETSYEKYISGWESLNIPYKNGEIADWHPHNFFISSNDEYIKLYYYNPIIGNVGIEKRKITFPENKEVYISNFPRAIIDLLLNLNKKEIKQLYGSKNELLSNTDQKLLYEYLMILKDNENIKDYLKYEYGYIE
ncbi:hypothetical protein STFE110948_02430 [Streptobacillus felis]|uniref:hypothetical protein n=1 Tax=Streptobacillus felis TaxID=1384509 RepID=UPI00082CB22A|nr:hypothetical protein [Streptobacillus felis]